LASCGGEQGQNYQPFIVAGWRKFFSLQPEDTCLVDVCSGNGAIACIAAEISIEAKLAFQIHAFDAANIAPPRLYLEKDTQVQRIHYRPQVTAESTHYPDRKFNVIVGQYAIEYTQLDKTLPELKRISKPNCSLRFILHAQESIVVASAHRQLNDIRYIKETEPLFSTAIHVVLAHDRRNGTGNPESGNAKLQQVIRNIGKAASGAAEPEMYHYTCGMVLDTLHNLPQQGTALTLGKIQEIEKSLDAHSSRLAAMTHAAKNADQIQELKTKMEAVWSCPLKTEPLKRRDGALFGWIIQSI